jgi:hypothetical protein
VFSVRKFRGWWSVCSNVNAILNFDSYAQALETARTAAQITREAAQASGPAKPCDPASCPRRVRSVRNPTMSIIVDPAMKNLTEVQLSPIIVIDHTRTLRTAADALALLREHETRPGVDDRDEVLHLERAKSEQELNAAVERFRSWLLTWGLEVPTAPEPGSTRGMSGA